MPDMKCWDRLGLAPTPDEREIKRAYARLLKTTRPEEDPEGFQALRLAFEEAMWQSSEMSRTPPQPVVPPDSERDPREVEAEALLRPHIEKLAELNEQGTEEEAMAKLEAVLDAFGLRDAAGRDPLLWQLFEDGMLWVCCDIAANHDAFLRAGVSLFGWMEPDSWLRQRDPKTVEWLGLRLHEADALEAVDELLAMLDEGEEQLAIVELARLAEAEVLINVDVRHLFEAELMVSLSEYDNIPLHFAGAALTLFGWRRDHRHLEEYHPDAWREFGRKIKPLIVF